MTWQECCRQAVGQLTEAGIENASAESWFLMEASCEISRNFYYLHGNEAMPPEQEARFQEWVTARCERIPLQHLTGEQEFMGLPFMVTPDVLIPRQDTEVLVELALEQLKLLLKQKQRSAVKVLDMCTGSGCIAVSLKAFLPQLSVTAADISEKALAVAEKNAEENKQQITFVKTDLFEHINETYDMIISNPPYIASGEIPGLMPEVRDHEPLLALDGKEDGLFFYRKIVENSVKHLVKGGILAFEIGFDQGVAVSDMMKEQGYTEVRVVRDLAGLDRVVIGRRE